jgi:serine/threonine protein kinase
VKRSASSSAAGAAAGPPSFSVNPADYRLMEEVGYGAHAVVYRAIFLPTEDVVAVKCLDLDQLNNNIVSSYTPSPSCNTLVFPRCCACWCHCCLI